MDQYVCACVKGVWQVRMTDSDELVAAYATKAEAVRHTQYHAIDWPAIARQAAIAYMAGVRADPMSVGDAAEWATEACENAEALIAEMKKRAAFGGTP